MIHTFRPSSLSQVLFALFAAGACSAQTAPSVNAVQLSVADSRCTREEAGVRPFLRPRHEDKHAARLSSLDADLKGPRADVLIIGDSIVQRWPDQVLGRAFPGQRLLNLGIRGERVADELFRLRSALQTQIAPANAGLNNFRAQSPRTVVALIGSNDLRGKTSCYIADGKVQIAAALRTLYPKARIVMLAILPRGNPQGQFAPQIAEVNTMVADIARKTGAFETADISVNYICRPQQICDVAIPKNFVHPSDKGYALLTPALRDYMARRR